MSGSRSDAAGYLQKNVSEYGLAFSGLSKCLALALYETLVRLELKAENDGVINQDNPVSRFLVL